MGARAFLHQVVPRNQAGRRVLGTEHCLLPEKPSCWLQHLLKKKFHIGCHVLPATSCEEGSCLRGPLDTRAQHVSSLWPNDCPHYPSPPEPSILLIFPVQPKGNSGFLLISLLCIHCHLLNAQLKPGTQFSAWAYARILGMGLWLSVRVFA